MLSSLNGTGHRVKQHSWISVSHLKYANIGLHLPVCWETVILSSLRGVWGALERFSFSLVVLMFCFGLIDLQLCLLPLFPL